MRNFSHAMSMDTEWTDEVDLVIVQYFGDVAEIAFQLFSDTDRAKELLRKTCLRAWKHLVACDFQSNTHTLLLKLFFECVRADTGKGMMTVSTPSLPKRPEERIAIVRSDEPDDPGAAHRVCDGQSLETSRLAAFLYSDPAVVAGMNEKELDSALNVLGIGPLEPVEEPARSTVAKALAIDSAVGVLKKAADCQHELPGLRLLPFEVRSVLLLAGIPGFSCEEIAEILGMPTRKVISCLKTGRSELKRHLPKGVSRDSRLSRLLSLSQQSIDRANARMGPLERLGDTRELEGRHVIGLLAAVLLLSGLFFSLGYVMGLHQSEASAADLPEKPELRNSSKEDVVPKGANKGAPVGSPRKTGAPAPVLVKSPPASRSASSDTPRASSGPSTTTNSYSLEVATVNKEADALELAKRLQKKHFPSFILSSQRDNYYRVQVGPYADPKSANATKKKLEEAGFEATVKHTAAAVDEGDNIAVPDFSGKTMREVTETCLKLGLDPYLTGNGLAANQVPAAGMKVRRGTKLTVQFGAPTQKNSARIQSLQDGLDAEPTPKSDGIVLAPAVGGLSVISLQNHSGTDVLVRLLGPSTQSVSVPDGQSFGAHVAVGDYYILVRYGKTESEYVFDKAGPLKVIETNGEHSVVSVTLQRPAANNLKAREEFYKGQ